MAPNDTLLKLEGLLAQLPTVESLGLNKAREGPPLPKQLGIKWPKPIRDYAEKHLPGVPIPRERGMEVIKKLPRGLGQVVLKIVDTFGL